jgi:hypothetical protein
MKANKGFIKGIAIGLAIIGVGVAYYFYSLKQNFNAVKKNLGGTYPDGKSIIVPFNASKNKAEFFSNGDLVISETSKANIKGEYRKGGMMMTLENGKNAKGSSVWANLLKLVN